MNSLSDWELVKKELWYRIPVDKAPRRGPPKWIAFYQTKIFKDEAYSIRYYGKVKEITQVSRASLFPEELPGEKTHRKYHKILLESLEQLPSSIVSFRLRRLVFIPTTSDKLFIAKEINELFDDSPLKMSSGKSL